MLGKLYPEKQLYRIDHYLVRGTIGAGTGQRHNLAGLHANCAGFRNASVVQGPMLTSAGRAPCCGGQLLKVCQAGRLHG